MEKSQEYKDAQRAIDILYILLEYYSTSKNFDELELNSYSVRDMLGFMSDHELPKRQYVQNTQKLLDQLNQEITNLKSDLKKVRLNEIEKKNLQSLVIIPSWQKVIAKNVPGFYVNRPVIDLRKDTLVMLNNKIQVVQDKLGNTYSILTGPGILYTEFSLDKGNYIVNVRPINMIIFPTATVERILKAPPIFESDLKEANINEIISIVPFKLIEVDFSTQAFLRGVLSRNVFHPNKNAIDAFSKTIHDPNSFLADDEFFILSAHDEYFNRLLITKKPAAGRKITTNSHNLTNPGLSSVMYSDRLLNELIPDVNERNKLLISIRDLKREYLKTGERIIYDWMP